MPGLEMPTRGGGAAMLRELREEERPPVAEEETETQETEMREKENNLTDQLYDNMTNNLTDIQAGNKSSNLSRKQTRSKTDNKADKTVSRLSNKSEGQPSRNIESQTISEMSVAEMIRRRAALRGQQEVLKTVTLKLSPSLDEKVEKYCFENKMKKQEFWAEAAALYFEMITEESE